MQLGFPSLVLSGDYFVPLGDMGKWRQVPVQALPRAETFPPRCTQYKS